MDYLILGVTTVLSMIQGCIKKEYNNRIGTPTVFFFSAILTYTAMFFFMASAGFKLHFTAEFLPYSIAFATVYATATVFGHLAIRIGSLSLSSLVSSYSLMIPTFWGIAFWGESTSPFLFIGIGLLAVSLLLINLDIGDLKFSVRWLIYVLIAFVANGMCSVTQRMQNMAFTTESGEVAYAKEFMVVALFLVGTTMLILSLITEREKLKPSLRLRGLCFPILCGVANGVVNLFVILLNSHNFNASVMFPVISAGGLVLTFFISMTVYREKFNVKQVIGAAIGVLSIVFLSL